MHTLRDGKFFSSRQVDVVRARSTEGVAVCHVRREVAILPGRNQVSRPIRHHIACRQFARTNQRIRVRVRSRQIYVREVFGVPSVVAVLVLPVNWNGAEGTYREAIVSVPTNPLLSNTVNGLPGSAAMIGD